MPIVRRSGADIDLDKILAELATAPQPSEAEIDRQAAEDGDAWTDEDFASANLAYPPPTADEIRCLRSRLGLSQVQFARRFGFALDAIQQYELGRLTPSGAATSLLRVIEADPETVDRALDTRGRGSRKSAA